MDWPAASVAGSAGEGDPIEKPVPWTDAAVTVAARVAVKVAVAPVGLPTVVGGKVTMLPASGGAPARTPKPSSLPSRVPTYTRPLATAGGTNLEAVPTGALHSSVSVPLFGMAL